MFLTHLLVKASTSPLNIATALDVMATSLVRPVPLALPLTFDTVIIAKSKGVYPQMALEDEGVVQTAVSVGPNDIMTSL